MVIVALQLSFVCLLRASETVISVENHFLRACDVKFCLVDAQSGLEFWIVPEQAYLYSSDWLKGCSIRIRSAKNDQGGRGYKYYFEREVSLSSTAAFDLVFDMFSLAQATRPEGEEAFCSQKECSGVYRLPYYRLNDIVKKVAVEMGQDPERYSSHSLRIGGATAMSLAGISDHIIMIYGRWKSLAFLLYARKCRATSDVVVSSILNPINFTSDDVIRSYGHNAKFRVK
jgi:hypothetical protein